MSELYQVPKGHETKLHIIRAMVNLGSSCPVAKMTVSDICKEVGISRQTFYRYFLDKYDALNWYNEQLYWDFASRVGHDLTWTEAGELMLIRTYDEQKFYSLALVSAEDYNSLLPSVSRLLFKNWRRTFELIPDLTLSEKLIFQLNAWSKLGPLLIADWVVEGCSIPIDSFLELMGSCIPQEILERADEYVLRQRYCRGQNPRY